MPERSPSKFLEQLRVLLRHEVDFIIVGGVAAVLEGAPVITLDLDLVYDRDPDNISRLAAALEEIRAFYNDPAGRRIVPDASKLESHAVHLLVTDLGGLDLLSTIGKDQSYADLLTRSSEYEVAGMRFKVLNLEALIEAKEIADREKDRAVLPILRRALEMKRESEK